MRISIRRAPSGQRTHIKLTWASSSRGYPPDTRVAEEQRNVARISHVTGVRSYRETHADRVGLPFDKARPGPRIFNFAGAAANSAT
jgi:hypothetical protein